MKYTIGIDFGTLSARALVVNPANGEELASAVRNYPHAVMDEHLPDNTPLGTAWALQHPQDYIDCMGAAVREAVAKANISPEDVIGIGIDFTSCTLLPVNADLTPLCCLSEYANRPHAYVKLWKHHGAQYEADLVNETAQLRGEAFLKRYGGKISCEWVLPKIWETLRHDPELYASTYRFMEAGDWLVSLLTGHISGSVSMAGYKALYQNGRPSKEYLRALDERLENVFDEKMNFPLLEIGSCAGTLNEWGASLTGLPVGTPVGTAQIDAHACVPGAGITQSGALLMILGTSACHMILSDKEHDVPGMCGAVMGGAIENLICYEAGQSCFGDHYDWFVKHAVPQEYAQEAEAKGLDIHALLSEKASRLRVGESGLLALDWWNGNRSVLVDSDLTGMILGMTLATRPEEIYRALIEATAYGTRMIVETFANSGVPIDSVYACGGIAQKNPLLMQILADVLNLEIRVAPSSQTAALGSAMLGASAAGSARGGYDSLTDAVRAMSAESTLTYSPNASASEVYNRLYAEYVRLHDYFGRGENNVMKRLRRIRDEVSA